MRWLLDEMLPRTTADQLNRRGHEAVSVYDAELAGAEDAEVLDYAVADGRVVVTENFADYSVLVAQRLSSDKACVPVVFVRKSDFPRGGALAVHLAEHLSAWATAHPEPFLGPHWPPYKRPS